MQSSDHKQRFFELALRKGNLRFGQFELKSGRISPYFFNAGGFDDGQSLGDLARCYADAIVSSGVEFDMLFGPAYKGIPLAAATAIALNDHHGRNVPYAYNRKEAKDHGEGGTIVGAPLGGRVLIIDDVISAGTSVRESLELIAATGAGAAAVAIALDRQERGTGTLSASQELETRYDLPCIAIAGLDDLIDFLKSGDNGKRISHGKGGHHDGIDIDAIQTYREQYGCQ